MIPDANKQLNTAKSTALKTLMGNKKLSNVLSEAWKAPIGSTKRTKAKSVLRSILMTNQRNSGIPDGMGGPGYSSQASSPFNSFMTPSQSAAPAAAGPRIENAPQPAPTSVAPDVTAPIPPKQTKFIKTIDHLVGSPETSLIPGAPVKSAFSLMGMVPQINNTSRAGDAYNWTAKALNNMPKIPSLVREEIGGDAKALLDVGVEAIRTNNQTKRNLWDAAFSEDRPKFEIEKMNMPTMDTPLTRWLGKLMPSDSPEAEVSNKPAIIVADPETGEMFVEDAIENPEELTPEQQLQIESANYDAINNMDVNERAAWFNGLDSATRTRVADIYDAVTLGLGAETWITMALGNKEILKNLNLPQEVIDSMPTSGLLSDQLKQLRDETKTAFQLDTQLARLTSLQNQGLTLEKDVKSYIRGKDEYLGKIDGMLEQAKDLAVSMDLSNPHIAKRMGNYTTYLTMLKGRQTQNYIDFANTSVSYYNDQMQAAQNLYESSYQKAEALYQDESAITAESYQNLRNMLGEMYTNVEGKTEAARDDIRWEYEVANAEATQVANTLKNYALTAELSGVKTDYKTISFNEMTKSILGVTENEDGTMYFESYDPYVVANRADAYSLPREDVKFKFNSISAKNIQEKASTGNFVDELGKYTKVYRDYLTTAIEEKDEVSFAELDRDWSNFSSIVGGAITGGMKEYFAGMENKVSKLRDAMKNLSGTGWGKAKTSSDKQSFMDSYKGELGDWAYPLFDFHVSQVADGTEPKNTFTNLLALSDNDLLNSLSSNIANSMLSL